MTELTTARLPGKYRHEHKYAIDYLNYMSLRQKLSHVMRLDSHADSNGKYRITSLYFDNCFDKALKEKLHGVSRREKFRLRYYNENLENIYLEKKQKINGLCLKNSAPIPYDDCLMILGGGHSHLIESDTPLIAELGFKMHTQLLRPRSVVRYQREAFIYAPGNVRVTFDSEISTGLSPDWFLESSPAPLGSPVMIMEIKYDEFLPEIIRHIVQPHCTRLQAFSKYASCRSMA